MLMQYTDIYKVVNVLSKNQNNIKTLPNEKSKFSILTIGKICISNGRVFIMQIFRLIILKKDKM